MREGDIYSFIKGRRFAFVGLAPVIEGKGLGREIDSFDVVARTNFPSLPEKYAGDYGKKCDIMALHVRETSKIKAGEETWMKYFDNGIRWIVHYVPVDEDKKLSVLNYHYSPTKDRINVSVGIVKDLGRCKPKLPTAGVNLISMALKAGASLVKVFGITGYQDKNGNVIDHHKGTKHYIDVVKMKKDCYSLENHIAHNISVQNDWIRYLVKSGKIFIDDFSHEYFK